MVNKRGKRPKSSRSRSSIVKELAQYRPKVGGRRGKLSILGLVAETIRRRALEGDLKAIDYRDGLRTPDDANTAQGCIMLAPEREDEEEWFRKAAIMCTAQEILDRRQLDPPETTASGNTPLPRLQV